MDKTSEKWLQSKLKEIKSFVKYVKPESVLDVALETGIETERVIKLNQNENLFLSKEFLRSLLNEVINEIDPRLYSKEGEIELRDALGNYVNLPSDYVVLGNGSDQIIDLIIRTFLGKDSVAISIKPTYSMYKWSVNHLGAKYFGIPLKEDFSLNVEDILKSSKDKVGICFICSPNNPTGNQFELEDMRALIENFPGLVLVDEAYVEFAKDSLVKFVKKYENLIITRTFSKAFGLAGARIGYALSNTEISTAIFEYAQLPYSLNCIGLKLALKALGMIDKFKKSIEGLKEERERLIKRLNAIKGVKAFKSDANFILFQVKKPYEKVFDELLSKGILVRKIGKVLNLEGCLRVTVGLPDMNESFTKALTSISE
ncbi:MAG: histidinol-phosphate transaminase [archaeon]|nr:histidinol-phosphate transaminase [archaeon]